MKLPNFIIVGAAKSGTTSLFDYLGQHPEVYTPLIKEPGFFIKQNKFSHITSWAKYQSIFKNADDFKAVGESSTTYLADEFAPDLIKEKLGDVKIIILLRNPIDMSYALWKHRKREVGEELSFFKAIDEWENRSKDPDFSSSRIIQDWNYIGRAKYFEQVQRYKSQFKDVKVFIFEEFKKDGQSVFNETCDFLNISNDVEIEFDVRNKSFNPKSKRIQKMLVQRNPVKEFLKRILPHGLLVSLKFKMEKFNQEDDNTPDLTEEERKLLASYFEEDVKKLNGLLDRNLAELWPDFLSK